jgi:hypothetical protein
MLSLNLLIIFIFNEWNVYLLMNGYYIILTFIKNKERNINTFWFYLFFIFNCTKVN